jgi:hypothetical protein
MKKETVGRLSCLALAAYFALSPIYAAFSYEAYASTLPLMVRYGVAPAIIAMGLLFVARFATPRWAALVAIYLSSVLCALFLFELLLTVRSIPMRFAMLGRLDPAQVESIESRRNVVRGFALNGLNHLVGTNHLSTSLLSGFPHTNVILCTPAGNIVDYQADRFGFNNPDTPINEVQDIMILGDSFAEGFCLKPGDDLASRIRALGYSTVTTGIRGNGPLLELAVLGRFSPVLRPRNVVMIFFEGNDWENLENELRISWLKEALSSSADFGTQDTARATMARARSVLQAQLETPVSILDVVTKTELVRNFFALQQTFTRLGLIFPKAAEPIPEYRRILRRAKEISQEAGAHFTLVYVPSVDRFLGPLSSDWAFDTLSDLVIADAAAESIDVIDFRKAFASQVDPALNYAADGHFSKTGAVFAAQVIGERLGHHRQLNTEIVQSNTE